MNKFNPELSLITVQRETLAIDDVEKVLFIPVEGYNVRQTVDIAVYVYNWHEPVVTRFYNLQTAITKQVCEEVQLSIVEFLNEESIQLRLPYL